jgi:site-specific DNA-methyltransferase (adenine-specific)
MEQINLEKKNKNELHKMCENLEIKNYKKLKKNELIQLINTRINESLLKDPESEELEFDVTIENERNIEINIENIDGFEYLRQINNNSINLILTDPPYIISKTSGMDKHYNNVKMNEENDITEVKSEEEWEEYKIENEIENDDGKDNYIKYGTIYGKKYCVKTDYGEWDSSFNMEILERFISEYYKKLRKGGTLIMFFDLWKITDLKNLLEKYNFKQIRFIEWIKTNPQPRNSKVNYLTNCREIALIGVKGGNPTFNSSYDDGIYRFPLQGGKNRFHPTQKSLLLFEELIKKHSNENDVVLDTFLGSGTTAIACKNTRRNFKGCEISKEYYDKILELI